MMAKSFWRATGVSAFLFSLVAVAAALPGCGEGGSSAAGPNEVVKNAPGVNPAKGAVPLDEEYKNMSPAGDPTKNK